MFNDQTTAAERLNPQRDPLAAALHYLRTQSKNGYCLDVAVKRLPPTKRPPTVLERWLARRSA